MKYTGNKSSDAEIVMDLSKGIITFDYSLNVFGNPYNSNTSCTLQKEYNKLKPSEAFLNPFYDIIALYARFATLPIFQKIIPQYEAQKITLWAMKRLHGLQEQHVIGKQETKTVTFYIHVNLWFEYELEGDYKDKIQKVELRRRFVRKIYKDSSCFKQDGWNVIFIFSESPQHGNIVLRSVN